MREVQVARQAEGERQRVLRHGAGAVGGHAHHAQAMPLAGLQVHLQGRVATTVLNKSNVDGIFRGISRPTSDDPVGSSHLVEPGAAQRNELDAALLQHAAHLLVDTVVHLSEKYVWEGKA